MCDYVGDNACPSDARPPQDYIYNETPSSAGAYSMTGCPDLLQDRYFLTVLQNPENTAQSNDNNVVATYMITPTVGEGFGFLAGWTNNGATFLGPGTGPTDLSVKVSDQWNTPMPCGGDPIPPVITPPTNPPMSDCMVRCHCPCPQKESSCSVQ